MSGIKTKTQYPARPSAWHADAEWPPDCAYELVSSGLLNGKSVSFLPLKVGYPTEEDRDKNPALKKVWRIVEEWLLLEYACVYLPAQQNAVVEAVSKGLHLPAHIQQAKCLQLPAPEPPSEPAPITHTSLKQIEQHIEARITALDFEALARQAVSSSLDRTRGRV